MAANPLEMLQMMTQAMPAQPMPDPAVEEEKQRQRERALQSVWERRIKSEEEAHAAFRKRGKEVMKEYNDRVGNTCQSPYPIIYQVTQVMHAGVFSSQPVPDCRPRNDESNPMFRQAADILERSISYFVDDQSFDNAFHRAIDDFLVVGLGLARVKMDATIQGDQVQDQTLRWEYVPWRRFGWEPCLNWKDCDWIYFRHPMTRQQIKDRFGVEVKPSKDERYDRTASNKDEFAAKTFDIYEIWDRKNKKVVFLAKSEDTPLEVNDDPLELSGFFPCPYPMMTNVSDEELIPKPDYDYYEFLASELNRLTERRSTLMESIKASGAYEQGVPEFGDMVELEDGEYKAVENLASRIGAAGGSEALFYHLPLAEKMGVVQAVTEQIGVVRGQIDDILGISDITRGVTNATETAAAQEIKGRWAGIRLARKRDLVQYTVREMFRIMGQVVSGMFTSQNLQRLTQRQVDPQVIQLLQSDLMLDFAIDIETESTVAKDEFKERQTRQEMLSALGTYTQSVMPLVQSGAMPAELSTAVLSAALQPYAKYSRGLDEAIMSLPDAQQQLQGMTQKMQQLQGQLQQTEQARAQWEQMARQLQMSATQATSAQKSADARKKEAETAKIYNELGQIDPLEPADKMADIQVKRTQAVKNIADARRPRSQ